MGTFDARRLVFTHRAVPDPADPDAPLLELTHRLALQKRTVGTALAPAWSDRVFLELQDAAGTPLFRAVADPFPPHRHGHSPQGGLPDEGYEVTEVAAGAFSVLVPDLPAASDVVLTAGGTAIAAPVRQLLGWSEGQLPTEFARFPFQETVA